MSLLMDPPKKADEARRQAAEATEVAASELTLAALSTPAPDATPSATAPPRPAERHAWATTRRPRRARWLLLALGALAASGLGGYFGWQLQSLSGGVRPVQTQTPARAQAPATPEPLPAASPGPAPAPAAPPTTEPVAASAPRAPAAPSSAPRPAAKTAAQLDPRTRPSRPSPAAGQAAGALQLSRSAPGTNPTLERAYAGLEAGMLDAAQHDYQQVLRSDANNTDALLGLATIATRQGQAELAQNYYLRALESDPSDATAQAGLINTRGAADPGLAESRLKSALASQPESSALHFALGNVYSRQARWSEAQQAYFRAYAAEPDNADVIFNLAVSLDHLHQNKLAAQYYQLALDGPRQPHRSFDANQVRQRILELQP